MNYWVTIYRLAWGFLVVLFVIVLICIFLPKCHIFREMQRKKIEDQEGIRKKEYQIKELRMKQERFSSDPAFVERTARKTGMVRSDETVFKFTNEQSRGTSRPVPE